MVQIVTPDMCSQTPERKRWLRKCGADVTDNDLIKDFILFYQMDVSN